MAPEADETITTRIKIEADEAIQSAIQFREEVDATKKTLQDIATTAKVSFDIAAQGIKDAAAAGAAEADELARVSKVVSTALKEAREEEADSFKAVQQLSKTSADLQIQEAKRIAEAEKETQNQKREAAKATEANLRQQAKAISQIEQESQQERRDAVRAAEADIKQQVLARQAIEQQNALEERQRLQEKRNLVRETETEIKQQIIARQAIEKQAALEEKQSQEQRRQAAKEREAEIKQQVAAIKELEKQTQSATKTFRLFGIEIKNVGDIAKAVFVGLFGFTIIGILRNVARFLGDAAKQGLEFSKSFFQLEVGVRALQQSGLDITIQEVRDQLGLLREEFTNTTTKELQQGAASFATLTRELSLTKEQFFELQRAAVGLSTITGKSAEEIQRTFGLVLSSGYTEGIQRLGISINRVVIAQEAANRGFKGGYLALDEMTRAGISADIMIERTNELLEDLVKYQASQPGQIDRITASWTEFTNQLGKTTTPVLAGLSAVFAPVLDGLANFLDILGQANWLKTFGAILAGFSAQVEYAGDALKKLGPGLSILQQFTNYIQLLTSPGAVQARQDAFKGFYDDLGDLPAEAENVYDKIATVIESKLDEINEVEKEFAQDRADIVQDAQRDLERIERDGARKRQEIAIDYGQKISEIFRDTNDRIISEQIDYNARLEELARDLVRAIEEAAIDLQQRLEDAERNLQQKLADAEREYRDKQADAAEDARRREIEAEEDYQDKLLRLREQFLFDLEDALRERDAKQVLRLIRQFNLRSAQLGREAANERAQRARDRAEREKDLKDEHDKRIEEIRREYERELEELKLKHQREIEEIRRKDEAKREEAKIDYENRIEEIKRRRDIEIREATIGYQLELAELQRAMTAQRQERLLRLAQQNQDLVEAYNQKLRLIAQGIASELKLTGEGAFAVYSVLYQYFGPGGLTDQLFRYYVESAQAAAAGAAAAIAAGLKATENTKTKDPNPTPTAGGTDPTLGFARGGTAYADRPTLVKFGEVPEVATFTPLSAFTSPRPPGSSGGGGGSSQGGKLGIRIMLDNGLVAEIVDNSLGEVATILERYVGS